MQTETSSQSHNTTYLDFLKWNGEKQTQRLEEKDLSREMEKKRFGVEEKREERKVSKVRQRAEVVN
jgi:hypothetical protein